MKLSSTIPFTFRRVVLAKGESDFDVSKLNTDEKKYLDGLVKAEIVTLLDATSASATHDLPSLGIDEVKKAFADMQDAHAQEVAALRAENDQLRSDAAATPKPSAPPTDTAAAPVATVATTKSAATPATESVAASPTATPAATVDVVTTKAPPKKA